MLKKLVFIFVLTCFSFSAFASEPTSVVQSIQGIISELKEEQQKSDELIQSLQENSEKMKIDLNEVQTLLSESLASQKKQIEVLENYGNLIDDQAVYYHSLNRKLVFWRTTSIVCSVSLIATVVVVVAVTGR